jgi:murein DD-endopeptidase MepM/ murein hydrolase activator NlpD
MAKAKRDDEGWLLMLLIITGVLPTLRAPAQAAGRWVWPLVRLPDGRVPVISDGFHVRPGPPPTLHDGVDCMYRRPTRITGTFPFPDSGSPLFELPAGTPVLAAADGKVWSCSRGARGGVVVIDHGKAGGGRSTVYRHLDRLDIEGHTAGKANTGGPPTLVKAGDTIGTAGYDPTDRRKVRHLHFELRDGSKPFDPQGLMRQWEVLS